MFKPIQIKGIGMTSQRTRDRLIQRLRDKGIQNEKVLEAMRRVPRHLFVDEALASRAYEDTALPIGHQQTISQPYIVALMTSSLLAVHLPVHRVLEIGTGSGYQAAILAQLVESVYSVERIQALQLRAVQRFAAMKYRNIQCKLNRDELGWKAQAPFDGIIVTAAATELPLELLQQLKVGGRLVAPIGDLQTHQTLYCYERGETEIAQYDLGLVKFVPLITA